jgi:hypothetical protein
MTLLFVSNTSRLAPWTGICAGCLVAIYIAFEAPFSTLVDASSIAALANSWSWNPNETASVCFRIHRNEERLACSPENGNFVRACKDVSAAATNE